MYFMIEQNEDKLFEIRMTEKFYKIVSPFYKKDSYFNIFYRLFNLLPKDFYHYVGYKYHAVFQKSKYIKFVKMMFKTKEEANVFCKEINRRLQYCVDREDFA